MKFKNFFAIIAIGCMSVVLQAQTNVQIDSSFLRENAKIINTINETSDNSDLEFLNKEFEHVDIVMLGEQSHGDGSTFLAKTRLIKYLHENEGFNVLVFESGMADMYRVWKKIVEGDNSIEVFDYGIFQIWTKSEQTEELFEYILEQSKTDNPLILAGFDMQPTGLLMTPEKRWLEISEYLIEKISFSEDIYPQFSSAYKDIRVVFSKEFNNDKMKSLIAEFNEIIKKLELSDNSINGKMMLSSVNNYLKTIQLYTSADMRNPGNTPHVFNIRDKVMAENFKFLKEEVYPDRKFIVWGANSHLGYGRGFLGSLDNKVIQGTGMVPMGQYLKIDYQDAIYSLAFTSYNGTVGSLRGKERELDSASDNTLEGLIAKHKIDFAFLSMRNDSLKTHRFATRIYGHGEMSGIWAQMCDGIFFIKTMLPNTIK